MAASSKDNHIHSYTVYFVSIMNCIQYQKRIAFSICSYSFHFIPLLVTNISPSNAFLKMIFLFCKVGYVSSREGKRCEPCFLVGVGVTMLRPFPLPCWLYLRSRQEPKVQRGTVLDMTQKKHINNLLGGVKKKNTIF